MKQWMWITNDAMLLVLQRGVMVGLRSLKLMWSGEESIICAATVNPNSGLEYLRKASG